MRGGGWISGNCCHSVLLGVTVLDFAGASVDD